MENNKTGEFKSPMNFICFISAKGNINFISNIAKTSGKYLSGSLYNDVEFELEIFEDGTCNFNSIGVDIPYDVRSRFLDIFLDKSKEYSRVHGYKFIKDVPFYANWKVSDDKEIKMSVFLALKEERPIDKLASIFDNVDKKINTDTINKLDSMFGDLFKRKESSDVETDNEENQNIKQESTIENDKFVDNSYLNDSFNKMKEQKIDEISKKIQNTSLELKKAEVSKIQSEKLYEKIKNDLKILEDRLYGLRGNDPLNGYLFNVSQSLSSDSKLDDKTYELISSKVSKIKSINAKAFMSIFDQDLYRISFAKIIEEGKFDIVEDLDEDLLEKIHFLSKDEEGFYYTGDMNWHEIVDSMIRLGFSQNSEFDSLCESKYSGVQ